NERERRKIAMGAGLMPEDLSWHDNLIYGVRFEVGDADRNDWRSDLALDIDHIVEWLCGVDGGATFRVAPATLTFHDVTDLHIDLDFADGTYPRTLNELSIDRISVVAVDTQFGGPGPYGRYTIALNLPQGGAIAFGASGFSQVLRSSPRLTTE